MNSIDYLVKSAIIKVPHTKGMGGRRLLSTLLLEYSREYLAAQLTRLLMLM